jgi:ubiquinone/menaquinone biosynthesis C-methylase UbiE
MSSVSPAAAPTSRAATSLFDRIAWRDPVSGAPLEPIVIARTPAGVPITGALRIRGTSTGYPIVDGVVRLTPALAHRYRDWLTALDLEPPAAAQEAFQDEATVDSFGFQWSWNSAMRSDEDLRWRVANRFKLEAADFADKTVLDAGAGAGDQSRWMLASGANVVSVDLSAAIHVVASKLRDRSNWCGVQADITMLPFADETFDLVYCEGVIQHTRDSAQTVGELLRVVRRRGLVLATHYGRSTRLAGRIKQSVFNAFRRRLSRWPRYNLLLTTGLFAAASYVPLLGRVLRAFDIATYQPLMPDFKTTWTNTFDNFGNHAYQRYVSSDEFWGYFQKAGGADEVYREGTLVVARRKERG